MPGPPRVKGTADRVEADKAAMLALPPVPPVPPVTEWHLGTRLARDHYVRVDDNDYSIHPGVIGRRIEVSVDRARVRARCDGQVVADHERSWAKHQSFTHPAHVDAAVRLRRARRLVPRPTGVEQVQQRELTVFDAISEQAI